MAKTEIVNQTIDRIIDGETGEIMQEHQSIGTRTIYKQEPPYLKLYIQDMLYMRDMPKALTNTAFTLAKYATYADKGLRIYLPTGLKKELINELETTKASFDNNLAKLCKGKVLRRVDIGVYELSPWFFGKGEWKDIENVRTTWDYSEIQGRTFSTVFSYKDGTEEEERLNE